MEMHNLLEEEVIRTVNSQLKETKIACDCDRCRMDIVAITLNNLTPKYVVSEKGRLYGKINNMTYQHNADIVKEVAKAIIIVGENPLHDLE